MIKEFVDKFMSNRQDLINIFSEKHPDDYKEIVKSVISILAKDEDEHDTPDPERIHEIDDGDYQGTLLFIIAKGGYQPSEYWAVKVYYGSCSGCDTLQDIRGYEDGKPSELQVKDYMTLALHIVQGLTKIEGDQV